jgi:ribose transport system substrate-binding protein
LSGAETRGAEEGPGAASSGPSAAAKSSNALGAVASTAPGGFQFPVTAGKYTVLGILTDNKDQSLAKSNAEGALTRYPDLQCMVGLWAYNPPAILQAVRTVGREGQVKIVGFDEHPETLQAVSEGQIVGTIVQRPYEFGYRSVEHLAALVRGQPVEVPPSKMIFVPHSVVTAANVQEFQALIEQIKAGNGPELPPLRKDYNTQTPVKLSFITNSVDPFWQLAKYGCDKANAVFNAQCETQMPTNGTVEEQKRFMETNITNGFQGMAISPIDPANQGPMIDAACAAMPVICQDSDAPNSQRLYYLGTSNYMAGRSAGELVKQALPEGGTVMIFVGKMEVLNAQERSRGLIDELSDKPLPPMFRVQPQS